MKKELLETGKIVSTHGLHGEVKILPWADSPEFLLEFDRVFLGKREYAVEDARVQKTCVLMKLEGIDTVEDAAKLRDQVVFISREDIELEEGAIFIQDLLHLPVLDESGAELGKAPGGHLHRRKRRVLRQGRTRIHDSRRAGICVGAEYRRGLHPRAAH